MAAAAPARPTHQSGVAASRQRVPRRSAAIASNIVASNNATSGKCTTMGCQLCIGKRFMDVGLPSYLRVGVRNGRPDVSASREGRHSSRIPFQVVQGNGATSSPSVRLAQLDYGQLNVLLMFLEVVPVPCCLAAGGWAPDKAVATD